MSISNFKFIQTNGDKFRVGTASTTLKCFVYRGSENITELLESSKFNWIRKSSSIEPLDDQRWNSSDKAIGKKEIVINPEDTIGRTVFSCEVEI